MTRFVTLLAVTAIALSHIGCVVAVGNKGTYSAKPQHQQVVELNDEIYIVDVKTNKVRRIPRTEIENAEIAQVELKSDTPASTNN